MTIRSKFKIIAGALIALLAIVAIVWSVSRLWQSVAEMRNPPRRGLAEQLMRRKSKTMEDVLDGMIRENLTNLVLKSHN